MPVALLVKNRLGRQRDVTKRKGRDCTGRECMRKDSEFCRFPGDIEGCQGHLVEAWRNGMISKHCIIKGLSVNSSQCRQVLLDGLYRENAKDNPTGLSSPGVKRSELEHTSKEVVLFGYPLEIKAIHEIFYESYYKLVRSVIYRYGIKDNDNPSADDVSQNVFTNLHRQFLRGASIKGSLTTYITTVTLNECYRAIRSAHKHDDLENEDEIKDVKHLSATIIPFEAVDLWEYFDRCLVASEQGNLINRIILAQQCIEGCNSGRRPSAKQLRLDWQLLSQKPKNDIVALHSRVAIEVKRSSSKGVVPLTADLINSGTVEPYMVAIIFAAATGMDKEQTTELVEQLSNLSETAVHTRICRIYAVLGAKGIRDEKNDSKTFM